jgi:hypothetical protein
LRLRLSRHESETKQERGALRAKGHAFTSTQN